MGMCQDECRLMMAYFIMGRSDNSRNRVFSKTDNGIITEPADPSKVEDPSLILYAPVRCIENATIVTNGDQTDTIYESMKNGGGFEKALRTRKFEPDAPNYTPRISALAELGYSGFQYKMSILKAGTNQAEQRFFYEYAQPVKGEGHFVHTYRQDGNPLPSFCGEPVLIDMPYKCLEEFGDSVWESLNPENKVSLYVKSVNLEGDAEGIIYNRFEKV